jgi:hypothetical protein
LKRSNRRTASSVSSALIWRLTAPGVIASSSEAARKLSCRAAASNTRNAVSGSRLILRTDAATGQRSATGQTSHFGRRATQM